MLLKKGMVHYIAVMNKRIHRKWFGQKKGFNENGPNQKEKVG
jgi:hypothetical protein